MDGGLSTENISGVEDVDVKVRNYKWKGEVLDDTQNKEYKTHLKEYEASFSGDDYEKLTHEFDFLPRNFVITHANSDHFVTAELGLKYDWQAGQDISEIKGRANGSNITGGDAKVFVNTSQIDGKSVGKVEVFIVYHSDSSTNQMMEEDYVEFSSDVYVEDKANMEKFLQKIGATEK